MKVNERVKGIADKIKAKHGSLSIENVTDADTLIQPEATASGGKGAAGEPFTPVNEPVPGDDDEGIVINDDEDGDDEYGGQGDDGEGEGGEESPDAEDGGEREAEGDGKSDDEGGQAGQGKPKPGKGKGKPQSGGQGGDDDGSGGDGEDEDGQGGTGGSDDDEEIQCQYKVGDIVTIKRTGGRAIITSVDKVDGRCIYQLSDMAPEQSFQVMSNGGVVNPPQTQAPGYQEDELELSEPGVDYDDLIAQMNAMRAYRFKTHQYLFQLYTAECDSKGWQKGQNGYADFFDFAINAIGYYSVEMFYKKCVKKRTYSNPYSDVYRPLQVDLLYPLWTNLDYPEFFIKKLPFTPGTVTVDRAYEFSELEALAQDPNADPNEKTEAFNVLITSLQAFNQVKEIDFDAFKMIGLLSITHPDYFDSEKYLLRRLDLCFEIIGQDHMTLYAVNNTTLFFNMYSQSEDGSSVFDEISKKVDEGQNVDSLTIRKLNGKYLYERLSNATNKPGDMQFLIPGEIKYVDRSDRLYYGTTWHFLRSQFYSAYSVSRLIDRNNLRVFLKTTDKISQFQVQRMNEIMFSLNLKTIQYQ